MKFDIQPCLKNNIPPSLDNRRMLVQSLLDDQEEARGITNLNSVIGVGGGSLLARLVLDFSEPIWEDLNISHCQASARQL